MPITRIYPNASNDAQAEMAGNFGAGWDMLDDETDGDYISAQLSSSLQTVGMEGSPPAFQALPVGVGLVKGCVFNVRAWNDGTGGVSVTGGEDSGSGPVGRINQVTTDTPTTYSSGTLSLGITKAQIEALGWGVACHLLDSSAPVAFVSSLSIDADWDPAISGLRAMIFSLLGPLVGVALAEMPAIAGEVLRRSRTRIRPGEYYQAWRELREDRGRRYYFSPASRPYLPA
jgi:hypothetical protein